MADFNTDQLCSWEDSVVQTTGTNYLNQIYKRFEKSGSPPASQRKKVQPKKVAVPIRTVQREYNIMKEIQMPIKPPEKSQHLRNSTESFPCAADRHFPDYFLTENPLLNRILSQRNYNNQNSYLFALRQNSLYKSTKTSVHLDTEQSNTKVVQGSTLGNRGTDIQRNVKGKYVFRLANSNTQKNIFLPIPVQESEKKRQLPMSRDCPIHQNLRLVRHKLMEVSFKRYYKSQYNGPSFSRTKRQQQSNTELACLSTKISKNLLNSLQLKN